MESCRSRLQNDGISQFALENFNLVREEKELKILWREVKWEAYSKCQDVENEKKIKYTVSKKKPDPYYVLK